MTASDPLSSQITAREWLPEAMLFPAIDPSAPVIVGGDDGDDHHGGDDDDHHHHDADDE